MVRHLPAHVGGARGEGSIPGSGRLPGLGHGDPLQDSCLENFMDRGVRRAMIHRLANSWTWQLSMACTGRPTRKQTLSRLQQEGTSNQEKRVFEEQLLLKMTRRETKPARPSCREKSYFPSPRIRRDEDMHQRIFAQAAYAKLFHWACWKRIQCERCPGFVQCTRWTMFNPLVKRQEEARALRYLGFSSKGRKYQEQGRNVFVRMKCLRSHWIQNSRSWFITQTLSLFLFIWVLKTKLCWFTSS